MIRLRSLAIFDHFDKLRDWVKRRGRSTSKAAALRLRETEYE